MLIVQRAQVRELLLGQIVLPREAGSIAEIDAAAKGLCVMHAAEVAVLTIKVWAVAKVDGAGELLTCHAADLQNAPRRFEARDVEAVTGRSKIAAAA
jgi:hypothetical protein